MHNVTYMAYSRDELQSEVQKSYGGFLNDVDDMEDKYMPSTSEMGEKAIERFEEENRELTKEYVRNNFNEILKELIKVETEIYKDYKKEMIENAPIIFLKEFQNNVEEYPKLQETFEEIKEVFNSEEDFEESFEKIYSKIYPVIDLVSESGSQGGKSRAGKNLEHHLENLIQIAGYSLDRQVDIDVGDANVDILLPSEDSFHNNPDYAAFIACQTTLKDRFRLSLSKLPSGHERSSKFIGTAAGLGIINNSDKDDLNSRKINEIGRKQFRVIAFDEVAAEYPDNNNIISYSRFISEELPTLAKYWDEKYLKNP